MKPGWWLLIGLVMLHAFAANAQSGLWKLTGNVKDSSGNPLQSASVFVSNSSKGTSTNAEGKFIISALPDGNYNLIISFIGFETQVYPVTINRKNENISVSMKPNRESLNDVVIKLDKGDREEQLKLFRKQFLGSGKNAKQTSIANEDKLLLYYDAKTKTLTAHSNDLLLISNTALGYNIKYLLSKLSFNKKTGDIKYFGYPLFEEMKASSPSEEKKWKKEREKTYEFSLLRFYRTLKKRNLIQQSYILGDLVKVPQDQVQTEGTLKGIGFFLTIGGQRYMDTLYWPDIPYYKIMTALPGQKYKLNFSGFLSVDVSSATDAADENEIYQPGDQFSVFSLNRPVVINEDGLPEDPSAIEYSGYWMKIRLSDLLPFDYKPGE